MSFASGSVSFQRFYIQGNLPSDVTAELVEPLAARAFGQQPVQSDHTQIGWLGPRHLFDTRIDPEQIAFGRFAHLAVRLDKLAPPANVLRSYVRMEEQAAMQASGRPFLSRSERRQAREAAVLKAEQEAREGAFRRMSSCPVLIDLEAGVLYLGTTAAGMGERVMQLFRDTFGGSLEPVDAGQLAARLMIAARNSRALDNLAPFHLVKPPADEAGADFAGLTLGFLGREFLTWLWYRCDCGEGRIRLSGGDEIAVMIDRTLRLKCAFGLSGTDVITADGPGALPEARAALSTGKLPTRAGLIVGGALGEFRFTLDAERMAVSGLVLPEPEERADGRARLEQRFESIADAADLLDGLFELFLVERTASDFAATLRKMSAWAAGTSPTPQLKIG